jgi:tetratricopeptide (TPR) repeat protein
MSANTTDLGTTIRFFISSTFVDFQTERDVLQRRVFPELGELCAASGFRLQPIDLRWGVSEAAGTDRQTLRICFDELERCRRLSPDCFMVILLGERYGSYILPPQVPAALIEQMLPHLSPGERVYFDTAYRLDENAVPPEYVLLRVEGPEQAEDEVLRQVLVRAGQAAAVGDTDRLLFEGSATHREIQLGLLGEPLGSEVERGVLCAVRTFTGRQIGPALATHAAQDQERADRVRQLTADILARLPREQVENYTVHWEGESGPQFDADALAETYLRLLRPKLEDVISARTAARRLAETQGRDAVALANAAFAHERAVRVEGREPELARLAAYLAGETGTGLPLVVTGAAGSGKSTLLAEAATRAAAIHPLAACITRYIGVTPDTETLVTLLTSLSGALARAYDQPEPEALTDENALIRAVASQLATLPASQQRPLLLVIDALDQLGVQTQRTDWLPPRLAPSVRVVVSVLAERPEVGYLRSRLSTEQIVPLAPLSREVGQTMLRDLLAETPQRMLTPSQEEAVLDVFATQGLPLYIRLAASEARHWRSFDPPHLGTQGDAPLPGTTPALLQAILQRLEAPERHGRTLVARALGDLAAARFGLAEDELLAVLARDEDVREAQRTLSPSSPPIATELPLPVALWARLYAELAPLLAERAGDQGIRLLTFYHQQLRAAVEVRYLTGEERVARHAKLAAYFAGQPWHLGPSQWNWRKARELVTQQEQAGDRTAAEQMLNALADELEQVSEGRAGDSEGVADLGIARLIGILEDRLTTGGYWREGQRLYARLLANDRQIGDRVGERGTLGHLGTLASRQGRYEEAAHFYEQALDIARAQGAHAGEGAILNNLGLVANNLGHYDDAAGYFEQALEIMRRVGNRIGEGNTLNNLGVLAKNQRRFDEAAHFYEQALETRRAVGDLIGEGDTLNNLGVLANNEERHDDAKQYFEQALTIIRAVGDRANEGYTLGNLGSVASLQEHYDEAKQYYEQGLAIVRGLGDRAGEAHGLGQLGILAAEQGHYAEAKQYLVQALAIAQALGDRRSQMASFLALAAHADVVEHLDEAAQYFVQALALAQELGDHFFEETIFVALNQLAHSLVHDEQAAQHLVVALGVASETEGTITLGPFLSDLGAIATAKDHDSDAQQYFEQGLAIVRASEDRVTEGKILENLGILAEKQGNDAEAARYYEQALAIRQDMGDRAREGDTLNNLGLLAKKLGKYDDAMRLLGQVLAIRRAVGDRQREAETIDNLGRIAGLSGRYQEAERYFEEALAIYVAIDARKDAAVVQKILDELSAGQRGGRRGWWPFGRRGG